MNVAELIKRLQQYDSDRLVVINDADTHWSLNIEEVECYGDEDVSISGSYNNIVEKF